MPISVQTRGGRSQILFRFLDHRGNLLESREHVFRALAGRGVVACRHQKDRVQRARVQVGLRFEWTALPLQSDVDLERSLEHREIRSCGPILRRLRKAPSQRGEQGLLALQRSRKPGRAAIVELRVPLMKSKLCRSLGRDLDEQIEVLLAGAGDLRRFRSLAGKRRAGFDRRLGWRRRSLFALGEHEPGRAPQDAEQQFSRGRDGRVYGLARVGVDLRQSNLKSARMGLCPVSAPGRT